MTLYIVIQGFYYGLYDEFHGNYIVGVATSRNRADELLSEFLRTRSRINLVWDDEARIVEIPERLLNLPLHIEIG